MTELSSGGGGRTSSAARDVVLDRVRRATAAPLHENRMDAASSAKASHPSDFHESGQELVAMLIDRLEDYRADVVRTQDTDDAIGEVIGQTLANRGIGQVIVPVGLPSLWTTQVAEVTVDDGSAGARDLDRIPAVVTGAVVAVAETGTIVLDGSPRCGRRAISLVPDTHVCVVRAEDVVRSVPQGLARLDPARPLTFISGPSATSDIELSRVEGVHGPRTLIVVIADQVAPS